MFIDEAEIQVRSGKGGDGAVHFRREKYVPRGGPDGGDGGRGGDVILKVQVTLNTLSYFRHQTRFHAEDGRNGAKQNMTGRSGQHLVIPVPPGTLIYDAESGELLGDLTSSGQELTVAQGGRGGRGNTHFATARNQVPRIGEKGAPAEQRKLRLELKLIADIGVVGAPNAGKSTFLSVVTNAKPKIAPYPFTTLEPNLGVAELGDARPGEAERGEATTLVLADIPGLIEGAHQGVGLGHAFLRHIQRTRVLIHLLDGLAEDPLLDYAQINSELALFDPRLGDKPQVVALNKLDLPEVQARWDEVKKALRKRGVERPMAISAATGQGVRELLYRAAELQASLPPETARADEEMPVYRAESDPNAFHIEAAQGGFRVVGAAIERAAAMTYWEYYQSVSRFQRILETLGVDQALRDAGVQEGDSVYIGDHELEWHDTHDYRDFRRDL